MKKYEFSENITGQKPKQKSVGYVTPSPENAVFTLIFEIEKKPVSYGEKFNDDIWKGSVAEIMIELDSPKRYLELSVNPNGVEYAVIIENDLNGNFQIAERLAENPAKCNIKKTYCGYAKRWRTDFEIPFKELRKLGLKKKSPLRFGLFRQDLTLTNGVEAMEISAAFPTLCETFHRPEFFRMNNER